MPSLMDEACQDQRQVEEQKQLSQPACQRDEARHHVCEAHDPQFAVGDMPDLMRQNPGEFSPSSWSSSRWVTQMALSSGLPRPKAFGSRLGTR